MPGLTRASPSAPFKRNQTKVAATNKQTQSRTATTTPRDVIEIEDTDVISVASTEHDRRQASDREHPICVTVEYGNGNPAASNRDNGGAQTRFRGVARHNLTKYYVGNNWPRRNGKWHSRFYVTEQRQMYTTNII